MTSVATVVATIAAVILLSPDQSNAPTLVPAPSIVVPATQRALPTEFPEVDWSNYDPEFKTMLEKLYHDAECDRLNDEFLLAFDNDGDQRRRTGEGNAALMRWIDAALAMSGCYYES